MHVVQRAILTLNVVIVLLYGLLFAYGVKAEKAINQWENVKTEQFMEKVVRMVQITEKDLLQYANSLNYTGVCSNIRVEKYQREEDITGENYFRMITSEEIQEEIINSEMIYFERGSMIKVIVYRTFGKQNTRNMYVKTVFGRG